MYKNEQEISNLYSVTTEVQLGLVDSAAGLTTNSEFVISSLSLAKLLLRGLIMNDFYDPSPASTDTKGQMSDTGASIHTQY